MPQARCPIPGCSRRFRAYDTVGEAAAHALEHSGDRCPVAGCDYRFRAWDDGSEASAHAREHAELPRQALAVAVVALLVALVALGVAVTAYVLTTGLEGVVLR